MAKSVFLSDMTWPEVGEHIKEGWDMVLIPAGQTEQHGPHLPIKTDYVIAETFAAKIAEATGDDPKVVVAPTISYGFSDMPGLIDYPGVFTLSPATLVGVYTDVARSLVRMGFKRIVFIDSHGGNPAFLAQATDIIVRELGVLSLAIHWYTVLAPEVEAKREAPSPGGFIHADEIETSVAMACGVPVREDKLGVEWWPDLGPFEGFLMPFGHPKYNVTFPAFSVPQVIKAVWPGPGLAPGPVGNTSKANKKKGEEIMEMVIAKSVEILKHVSTLPLPSEAK